MNVDFSINNILKSEIKKGKSPSVQYIFFDENNIIHSFKDGFSDIKNKKMTSINTTYNAFSVTKTFTALSVLQLFENGKLDINNPIIQYLPTFPYNKKITIKQILNHTSGIPNPIPLSWIHLDSEHTSFNRDLFFAELFNKHNKAKEIGTFSYSNLGYVILGQLIEKVSGLTYEKYIEQNIVQKLFLNNDDLSFKISNKQAHATGYNKQLSFLNFILGFFINKDKFMKKAEGKWRPFKHFYVNGASYGGLIANPKALIKYAQELLKDDSNIIDKNYKKILFSENKNTKMCLSWFTGEINGVKYFTHAGGGGGYYSEIRIYPSIKKASAIFFNRTGVKDERFLDKVDKLHVNKYIQ